MTAIIVTVLVVAGLIINGLRLRARVPSALPVVDAAAHDGQPGAGWLWITARGTAPDGATRRDAAWHAHAEGLDMLELVPGDLPVTAARDLLRVVDPRAYQASRLAIGRSAGAALLVSEPVAGRAGTPPRDAIDPAGRGRARSRRRDRMRPAHPALHLPPGHGDRRGATAALRRRCPRKAAGQAPRQRRHGALPPGT